MPVPDTDHPMETRCSVAVFRHGSLLLVRSEENGAPVWKLPGGHVRPDEGLVACARRELREETGLAAESMHCALVLDVQHAEEGHHTLEIVLFPTGGVQGEPIARETGHDPCLVPMDRIDALPLRPAIQSQLHGLKALHERELAEDEPVVGAPLHPLTQPVRAPDRAGPDTPLRQDTA